MKLAPLDTVDTNFEQVIMYRTMLDLIKPKLVYLDLPLFMALLSDLFPGGWVIGRGGRGQGFRGMATLPKFLAALQRHPVGPLPGGAAA